MSLKLSKTIYVVTSTMIANDTNDLKFYENTIDSSDSEGTSSSEDITIFPSREFDLIQSALSLADQHSKHSHRLLTRKGIKRHCGSVYKFIKQGGGSNYRSLLWKRRRKQYIILNIHDIRRAERIRIENEYYSREYEKLYKPVSDSTAAAKKENNAAREKEIEKALDVLKNNSKSKISLPPAAGHFAWKDAPLTSKCCCPTKTDLCICKGNALYPGKFTPFATYVKQPKNKWLCIILGKCRIINRNKAGTFVPSYQEAVRLETKLYKNPKWKELRKEMGPEFCFSLCHEFFKRDKSNSDKMSNLAKMDSLRNETKLAEMPEEKVEEPVIEEVKVVEEQIEEEEEEEEEEQEEEEIEEEEEDGFGISDRMRDEYYTSEGTMTDNDEIGDLFDGEYSHLLFGSCDYTHLKDISGTCLQITNFNDVPKAPMSIFDLESIFHFKALKKSISSKIDSKIKKIKKDFVTSVFELQERHIDRETQFDCNDIPDSGVVCETLVDAIRRHREKIKKINLKYNPLEPVVSVETTDNNVKEINPADTSDVDKGENILPEENIIKADNDSPNQDEQTEINTKDTDSVKTELLPHSNLAKPHHASELNNLSQKSSQLADCCKSHEDGPDLSKVNENVEIKVTEKEESKLPNSEPISPSYPCSHCKEFNSNDTLTSTNKIKAISEPIIKNLDTVQTDVTKSLQETTKPKEETASIHPWLPCRLKPKKISDFEGNDETKSTTQPECNKASHSPITSCPQCTDDDTGHPNKILLDVGEDIKTSKEKTHEQSVFKEKDKSSKENINKNPSCVQENSKNMGKRYQSIMSESVILGLSDIPCTSKKIKELDMMKFFNTSNKSSNFEKLNESINDTLNTCIRDMYNNSKNASPSVCSNFSKETNTSRDVNETLFARNNKHIKLPGSDEMQELIVKEDSHISNIIYTTEIVAKNRLGTPFIKLNTEIKDIVNKKVIEVFKENSNSFNTITDEEQINVENYSTAFVVNENGNSSFMATNKASDAVNRLDDLKIPGMSIKESKASSRIIKKRSIKNCDILEKDAFNKSRRSDAEKRLIDFKIEEQIVKKGNSENI